MDDAGPNSEFRRFRPMADSAGSRSDVRHSCFVLLLAGVLVAQTGHAQTGHARTGHAWAGHVQSGHDGSGRHLRLDFAKSSETDLITGFAGDFEASPDSGSLIGLTLGTKLSDTLFGLPLSTTANIGVQHFDERGHQPDAYGVTAFVKAYYNWRLPFTNKEVRFGLGEGLSYVSRIPMSEQRDFASKGVESVKLMNYLEWTVDVPLRQFEFFDSLFKGRVRDVNVGFVVWHRSTVFGLWGESAGGINYMGIGFEAQY
ncbi:MAG: hypothetical protein DIU71_11540 [Proteobacteria bacterium]|nr:MAG: hypothetical protein DIU71_11540 [Pseudomonadota bacterium]